MLRFSFLPTKDLTLNDLRVALINYIVAKQRDDGFILRIVDLDTQIDGREQESLDILKKFSIKEDMLVYQSENTKIYQEFTYRLIREKKAFACFCKSKKDKYDNKCLNLNSKELEELKSNKTPFKVRIKEPINNIIINDNIFGKIEVKKTDIDSFTILDETSKATPTFASAIDDMTTAITTIITNYDSIRNSAKELYIQEEIGYKSSLEYIHLPKIRGVKQYSIKELLKEGFLPDAIINYILSMGYENKKEIFYLPDTIDWFNINKVSKVEPIFNIEELKYFNKKHLKIMDSKKLSSIFGFADRDIGELLKLYLNEVSTINELEKIFKSIFEPKDCNSKYKDIMNILSKTIELAPIIYNFEEFIQYLENNSGLRREDFQIPLRILLTGKTDGPELKDIYPLIKSYMLEVARCR